MYGLHTSLTLKEAFNYSDKYNNNNYYLLLLLLLLLLLYINSNHMDQSCVAWIGDNVVF